MDQLIRELLRELTASSPAAAAMLRNIVNSNMSALELLRALYALLTAGLIDRAILVRLLTLYARAGIIDGELLAIAVAEAEADAAAAAAAQGATRLPWWRLALRGGIWGAVIYLAVATIADSNVELKHEPSGKGPCAINASPVFLTESSTSYGPKSAMKSAKDKIKASCSAAAVSCVDPACPTCSRDAAITATDVTSYVFAATAEVSARCQCWCI